MSILISNPQRKRLRVENFLFFKLKYYEIQNKKTAKLSFAVFNG